MKRKKDQTSKDRLAAAHNAMAEIDDELQRLFMKLRGIRSITSQRE